ncbi:hypothetical protein MVES1_003683 [Malassezia vespertilionis]|nr:uncharacterized protein MVES1_003683 [Malassezia vespertilionis]WFD08311.1 hypothetical protein MVES1_003683 [Malassezia vespertilionis]
MQQQSDAEADVASWTPLSQRVGLITRKMGMTTLFTPDGKKTPATVLYVDGNQISKHIGVDELHDPGTQPYIAVQVAAVDARASNITNPMRGHLRAAGITDPKRILREFRVTRDALVPLGTKLSAAHFVPGQEVDVRAITRGKGFAGVMKRHNFAGGNATHGASLAHRTPGSIGNNQDPGRVFPGKRMPGRMGGTAHRTVQNLRVLRVDLRNELVFVKGPVPGPDGGIVEVRDALKNLVKSAYYTYRKGKTSTGALLDPANGVAQYLGNGLQDLPFPAGTDALAAALPDVVEADKEAL